MNDVLRKSGNAMPLPCQVKMWPLLHPSVNSDPQCHRVGGP
jgi:hypothetical protein